jgi:ferredoxin--NADP+ reductase
MIQTSEYNASIVARENLHGGLFYLWVCPDGGRVVPFEPGQFVSIGCLESRPDSDSPRLITRSYSIGSSAQRQDALELFIVHVDDGALTSWLLDQPSGSRLWLSPRPAGRLTLEGVPPGKDLVLVSTGTGIAPYMSMYRTYRENPPWRRIVIVNGVRYQRDLGYRDELEAAAASDPGLTYIPLVTREPSERGWTGRRGRVQSVLQPERFERLAGFQFSPEESHVFLCGNPGMVDGVEADLLGRGFRAHSRRSPGNIHVEKYW